MSYTLVTKNATNIRSPFITTDPSRANQVTRGESAELTLHFPKDDLVVSSSYTVELGTTEQYDEIIVEDGATLTVNGELFGNSLDNDGTINNNGVITLYGSATNAVEDYANWAGKYAQQTLIDGTEKYREQIPSGATVDSIVLGVNPDQSLQDREINGFWGIVDSGTDARPRALSDNRYTLSLTVLAEFDEYADHSELEADLQL